LLDKVKTITLFKAILKIIKGFILKKIICFAVLTAFFSLHANADWDYGLEAKEEVQKKAEQEKETKEKAKTDAILKKNNEEANSEMTSQNKKTLLPCVKI
jgi:hypothetical protein